jgi:hypothetical protein
MCCTSGAQGFSGRALSDEHLPKELLRLQEQLHQQQLHLLQKWHH